MSIKNKLALLLGTFAFIFLIFIGLQKLSTRDKLSQYAQSVAQQKQESFETVFRLVRNSYHQHVIDLTFWDELVGFVQKPDAAWASVNIDASAETFGIACTLVYDTEQKVVYSYSDEGLESIDSIKLDEEEWKTQFQNGERFCAFFKEIDGEIYEVFGTTIHKSDDVERAEEPSGFFIIGKRYNQVFVDELSDATNSRTRITSSPLSPTESSIDFDNHSVRIQRTLNASDNSPLAAFEIEFDISSLRDLNLLLERQTVFYGLAFGLSIIVFLYFSSRWIRSPINVISDAIATEDPSKLGPLSKQNHEFSGLSKRVIHSFEQKSALDKEIAERTRAQEELAKARDAAESANRAKSEFLANMSHEIRTPMNAILGFTQLARDKVSDAKVLDLLQYAYRGGKMLLDLIDDILDLSKIEAGKLHHHPKPTRLKMQLEEVVALFRHGAESKGLTLDLEFDNIIPDSIEIDSTKLRQILINLIGNAIKFTDHGNVRVAVGGENINQDRLDLRISVIDTGIGIPDLEQEHVFENFSQQLGQDQQRYGGTGLGLAISKRFAELMGGSLTLQSRPGEGSTFILHLPSLSFDQHYEESDSKTTPAFVTPDFSGKTILVVDDNEIHRILISNFLEETQARILIEENGQNALATALANLPDLILSDSRMPVMNGYELLEKIKEDELSRDIPFIFVSATATTEEFIAERSAEA